MKKEIVFTKEMIVLLYNRVYEHCVSKYGVEVNHVEIQDGDVIGVTETYMCGDRDVERYYVSVDELNNTDYDKLREIRLEKLRVKKENERLEKERLERLRKERERKEEYIKYLELKQKFENT